MTMISVVIPSFNHERYLLETLTSLERQTYRDFEVVIVDDGSSDDSAWLIRRFMTRTAIRIHLIQQANAGAHAAIERGIGACSGAHIAILNSDDIYHPERLGTLLDLVPPSGPYLAFSGIEWVDENSVALSEEHPARSWYNQILSESVYDPGIGFTLMRGNISVSSSNFMFSREMHALAGPFRSLVTAHDLDFALRCIAYQEPVFVRKPLLSYRLHPKSTLKANEGLEHREVRLVIENYLREANSRSPLNNRAPGSRALAVYSSYFMLDRRHWFEPVVTDEPFQQFGEQLGRLPASADTLALRREVARLSMLLKQAELT